MWRKRQQFYIPRYQLNSKFRRYISYQIKKRLIFTYTHIKSRVLKVRNAGEVKVFDFGMICLKTNNGTTLILQNIKHATDIPLNLISVWQLDDDIYHNDFFNDQWKITKYALIVEYVWWKVTLYQNCGIENSVIWTRKGSHIWLRRIFLVVRNNQRWKECLLLSWKIEESFVSQSSFYKKVWIIGVSTHWLVWSFDTSTTS